MMLVPHLSCCHLAAQCRAVFARGYWSCRPPLLRQRIPPCWLQALCLAGTHAAAVARGPSSQGRSLQSLLLRAESSSCVMPLQPVSGTRSCQLHSLKLPHQRPLRAHVQQRGAQKLPWGSMQPQVGQAGSAAAHMTGHLLRPPTMEAATVASVFRQRSGPLHAC